MDVTQLVQYIVQAGTATIVLGAGKVMWSTSTVLAALKSAFDKHEEKDALVEGIILEELRELRRGLNSNGKD